MAVIEMIPFGPEVWDRMVRAVEKVRERLYRATGILGGAGIPYAVIGGNCVAAWVARVDEAAVRNTADVDILLRRADLPAAILAMEAGGFIYRHSAQMDMFLDGPGTKARDAVHVLMANEKVKSTDIVPTPDVADSEHSADGRFAHLDLFSIVRMKLTSYRRKDQVHLLDMLSVGLIDESWLTKFPTELKARLQSLLDDPEG